MLGAMRAGNRQREEFRARHPSRMPPAYPGEILRDDVLPALALSRDEAAVRLGITPAALGEVLAGTVPVTPALAEAIDDLCGNGGAIWLRMQRNYTAWHRARPRNRLAEALVPIGAAWALLGLFLPPVFMGPVVSWGGVAVWLAIFGSGIGVFGWAATR